MLIPATLRVYPSGNYGAIEHGDHLFCRVDAGLREGVAKFVMTWRRRDGHSQLTRIPSQGQPALTAAEPATLPKIPRPDACG